MEFKTAQQIREEREAAGKNAARETRRREQQVEKSRRRYARLAEESAVRETVRATKPKFTVNRAQVIVAPVLATVAAEKAEKATTLTKPASAPTGTKQIWDASTKTWVKR